jgi:hypothetical protein
VSQIHGQSALATPTVYRNTQIKIIIWQKNMVIN